jgi:hypothetical protein|tara:strand:- start:9072 stop:9650 length:579 start_codon:yes stop_codon:yes gene_type:complete
MMPRILHMPDPEAVRRLLEGDIDPVEIEDDAALYSMAERIYGSEALEELGVQAPEIGSLESVEDFGLISEDVSLPDFLPDISEMKGMDVGVRSRRRWFVFLTGFFGIVVTIFNMAIGMGAALCNVGVANMRQICSDDYGQTKVVWTEGYTYERLHEVDSWVKPMSEILVGDLVLIVIFTIVSVFGLLSKKKN